MPFVSPASYEGSKHLWAPDSCGGRSRSSWGAAEGPADKRLWKRRHRRTTSKHRDSPEAPRRSKINLKIHFRVIKICTRTGPLLSRILKIFKRFFFSGSSSIKRVPEAKEAGRSDPGVGGTLAWVLPVLSEFCGYYKHPHPACKIWFVCLF